MAVATTDSEIIDADGHVFERDTELFEFLDGEYAGRRTLLGFPFFPTMDGFHRGAIHARMGLHAEHSTSAAGWMAFLDAAGIAATVLYPSVGVTCGYIQDPDWAVALCRAYNSWLSARYVRANARLRGMALLPLQNVPAAVFELRRAVDELGLSGAVLPGVGLSRALGHRDFDPVYAEAQRLGCALAVHAGPSNGLGLEVLEKYGQIHALSHPSAQMIQLTSIVMNGVFDRFPNLRIAFLEGGAGWVPFVIDRMDRSYQVRRFPEYTGGSVHEPSWYVLNCEIYFGADVHERSLAFTIETIGAEHLLYCSDFPHEVNLERCRDEIQTLQLHPRLSPDGRQALLGGNARRLYRL